MLALEKRRPGGFRLAARKKPRKIVKFLSPEKW